MFSRIFKDPQIRLLFTGTLFAAAFVWMAMTSYGVDEEEIKVFLIMSFILVGLLIAVGLLFSFLLSGYRRLRGRTGMLQKISRIEAEVGDELGNPDGGTPDGGTPDGGTHDGKNSDGGTP